jgi:putative selenate reductase FAD-binding subunit
MALPVRPSHPPLPSFHRPATAGEAAALRRELGPRAFFLAGGTELNNPFTGLAPEHLISLEGLGLDGIEAREDGVSIGALTRIQDLADSPRVPEALRRAARHMGNRNVRNLATLGGQLGSNRSCADLLPALLALHAVLVLEGGARLRLEERDPASRELILAVEIPPHAGRCVGIAAHTRTFNDISLVTAAAGLRVDDGLARDVVLAIGGVAAHVTRLPRVEAALEGRPLPSLDEVEALVSPEVSPIDDPRGGAAFKRQLAAVLAARALHQAWTSTETR